MKMKFEKISILFYTNKLNFIFCLTQFSTLKKKNQYFLLSNKFEHLIAKVFSYIDKIIFTKQYA